MNSSTLAGPFGGNTNPAARVQTRLLSRNPSDRRRPQERRKSRDVFRCNEEIAGLLVVVSGSDKGQCFDLTTGLATIGRGDDQTVQLAEDVTVSRKNHAVVAWIPDAECFACFDGGKANPVLVNGNIIDEVAFLDSGDVIQLGGTALRFVKL